MTDGEVRYARDGEIATVIFDRPAARNAMTWRMYEQLGEACARIRGEDGLRVAVFRGAGGKAVIAGSDIAQFRAFRSGDDGIAYEEKMEAILAGIEALPVPTLAVIEGFAIGGGLALRRSDRAHARQLPLDCQLRAAGRRARRFARQADVAAGGEPLRRGGAGGRLSRRDRGGGGA